MESAFDDPRVNALYEAATVVLTAVKEQGESEVANACIAFGQAMGAVPDEDQDEVFGKMMAMLNLEDQRLLRSMYS